MATYTFNTTPGQTIARELLVAYLNVGTATAPSWAPIGKRVEESSEEMDWSEETTQDIMGNTFTQMKKPIITQAFDPLPLDAGEKAAIKIWETAIVNQDAQAMANQDMLIVHLYANFAERYESCMVKPTGLGGEGGGNISMPTEVTYGGNRTIGSVSRADNGEITFVPEGTPPVDSPPETEGGGTEGGEGT